MTQHDQDCLKCLVLSLADKTDSTSDEAEDFRRAQTTKPITTEATYSSQIQVALTKTHLTAVKQLPNKTDLHSASRSLTSNDIQDLINQIRSLQVEVTELKARQQSASTPPPQVFDPVLERFFAAQRHAQAEPTPSILSDGKGTIPPPPYALSDVDARDCMGSRYIPAVFQVECECRLEWPRRQTPSSDAGRSRCRRMSSL